MATTPNMGLTLPEVLVTSGPQYATEINTALDEVDSHDHSPGKGSRITPSGLNINASLPINNNSITNIKSLVLATQTSVTTNKSIYSRGVDLYYRDDAGNEIQLTAAGGVNVSGVGGFTGLVSPASATYTLLSETFGFFSDAAEYAKLATGDLQIFPRTGASPQAVTFIADAATSAYDLQLPATAPVANSFMRMQVGSAAAFVELLGTNNQVTVTQNTSDMTLSLPQDIHTGATPTFAGLTLTGAIGTTDINASGDVTLTKAAPATMSAGTYDATFNKVITDTIEAQTGTEVTVSDDLLCSTVVKTNSLLVNGGSEITMSTIKPATVITYTVNESFANNGVQVQGRTNGSPIASSYIGYEIIFTMGADMLMSTGPNYYDLIFFLVPAGEWEVSGTTTFQIDPSSVGSGNATVKLDHVRLGISTSGTAFDAPQYTNSLTVPRLANIGGTTSFVTLAVTSAKRRIRVSSSTTYHLTAAVLQDPLSPTNGSKFLASTYVKLERVG